jgi:hypothetical protein
MMPTPPSSEYVFNLLDFELALLKRTQASTGSVQYAPDKSAFVWKIKQLGGGRDFLMRAHFGLPSVKSGTFKEQLSSLF